MRTLHHWGQRRDLYLRVLAHNIALALLGGFYQSLRVAFNSPADVLIRIQDDPFHPGSKMSVRDTTWGRDGLPLAPWGASH